MMFGVPEGKEEKKNPIMKSDKHGQQEGIHPRVVFRVEEQLGPGAETDYMLLFSAPV